MSTEDDVRDLLHATADDAPPGVDGLPALVIGRYRTRRRTRRLGAAAVAVVAVVLGGIPLLAPGDPAPSDRTQVADNRTVDVLVGPPRGSLADDDQLLAGLLAKSWTDLPAVGGRVLDPAPETRTVVFAGEVGAIRTALVSGTVAGQRVGAWFTGPVGAPAEQLGLAQPPTPLATDLPVVRLDTTTAPDALVVMSAPGDEVFLSPAVTVTADGGLRRSYAPIPTVDGVATATVATTTAYGVAASVRIDRDGTAIYRGAPAVTVLPGPAPNPIEIPVPPGQPQPSTALVGQFGADLARATGADPAELGVRALWSGTLPGPDGQPAPAAVLTATYPSGAVAVAGGWALPSTDGTLPPPPQYCTFTFGPVGSDAAREPVAMRCDVTATGQATTSTVVLLGPPGAASAELLDADGAITAGTDLPVDVALLPADGDERSARFLDADGRRLTQVPLSPYFSGDLGRYGGGTR